MNSLGLLMAILLFFGGVAWGVPLSLQLEASGGLDVTLQGLTFSATLETLKKTMMGVGIEKNME